MDRHLSIEVHSCGDKALDAAIRANFGAVGGTIGRAPECTLVLSDPDRIISRAHATIIPRDGGFVLRDQGTTVPVIVNGRQVGRGREVALAHGDQVRIGGYTMTVDLAAVAAPAAEDDADGTTILREGATLLSWSEGGAGAPQGRIGTMIVPEAAQGRAPVAPRPVAAAPAPASGSGSRAKTPEPQPARDAPDELLLALLHGAGIDSLAESVTLSPAQMEEIGAVMREMMRGLLDLLAARAHAKREVRAEATMIGVRDNNPLKFSPGLEAAIAQFLVPRGTGFMPPLRAVSDACESLRSHQAGFVAGMRAALESVLARFDPAKLETQLTETSVVDSLIPMNHRARLWSRYEELYEEIARDAQGDFSVLFGEEFLRAYMAKVGTAPPS